MYDTARQQTMRTILMPHLNHTVIVNGYTRNVTEGSLTGDNVVWCYGGFAVDCTTCKSNLSQQW